MIEPGVYDNTSTMAREVYHRIDGEIRLVQSLSATAIEAKHTSGSWFLLAGWGLYPDVENDR